MRLIFIRHAEPDYAKDSLTEKGWREAEFLAERVQRWKVDEFYCSPLGRARDTASASLRKCGRRAAVCDWLREFDAPVIDPETGKKRLPWDLWPGYWTKVPEMHSVDTFADTDLMRTGRVKEEYARVCAGIDGESLKVCLQVLQQMWKNITGMTAQTEGAASCGKGDR